MREADMVIFRGRVSLALHGCSVDLEFELPADATAGEIESALREAALEHVEWWAEPVGEAGNV